MMAICFWEATFDYKSYHLSDCYRLYISISCKNNIRKALKYQIDLSDWYQLYISCKINIETPITLSNRYERSIFFMTDDGYSCNHAEWESHHAKVNLLGNCGEIEDSVPLACDNRPFEDNNSCNSTCSRDVALFCYVLNLTYNCTLRNAL